MTDVERVLWRALRGKQLNGHRFRRQHPIGRYIADFACIEQKIVIELDGGQHQEQLTVKHHCTSSIGVMLFINHEDSPEDILKWADTAMYQAKEAGRNLIRFYEPKV